MAYNDVPIVTVGIAQRSREAKELWSSFETHFGKPKAVMPQAPYCMVELHPNMMAFPDALEWIGDLERCIAWAWISRNPAIGAIDA